MMILIILELMRLSNKTKHIFITGGVVSGLGKGLTASSLGLLLKARGFGVTIQKFDPYLNTDAGTMNPLEHGEVYVTDDGSETDLDLGHYERFIDENLSGISSVSSGQIYQEVLDRERRGDYLGKTIQVIPHITNEIKRRMTAAGHKEDVDIVITEIGGTVGDIEGFPFIEAIRQLKHDIGSDNTLHIHCTLVPYMEKVGEFKSKPTQYSLKELRGLGVQPDAVVGRIKSEMPEEIKEKISLFGDIEEDMIFESVDVEHIYEVPLKYEDQFMAEKVLKRLGYDITSIRDMFPEYIKKWRGMVLDLKNKSGKVKIALVGKYVELEDAYLSIKEALSHAAYINSVDVEVDFINSEEISSEKATKKLKDADGILVPGGFGSRGIEGKILAAKYARENDIPYFGICLGMQVAVIEYARNVLGLPNANSIEFEFEPTSPVISLMEEQKDISDKGGTMRLGAYDCELDMTSKAYKAYEKKEISERHRHRFEFNNYFSEFFEKGMIITGINPELNLVEIIELEDHPWFVGVQFHPEFKSRPLKPHPLFKDFIRQAILRGRHNES